jgi:hypothetical protein
MKRGIFSRLVCAALENIRLDINGENGNPNCFSS